MADKMMKKDLVLESTSLRWWGWDDVEAILPNIPSQRYAFGSKYLGEREGEEFIFTGTRKAVLAIISVDDWGQYWIQNDTRNVETVTTRRRVYSTFVNGERVKAVELRLLKSGDRISFGGPITLRGPGGHGHPIFCVKERTIRGSDIEIEIDIGSDVGNPTTFSESPLTNNLILSEIMSYLHVRDLKNARLVCKKWKEEATKHLEKRGQVSFSFEDYLNPEKSTMVFRYLHEMRAMKMRNLKIFLDLTQNNYYHKESPSPSVVEKMVDDLRKLLKSSHNFSSLVLKADIGMELDFSFVSTILQELGGKLVKLTFDGELELLPEIYPPFPLMTNLKKFTHRGYVLGSDRDKVRSGWVSLLVPLFSRNLEHFTCRDELAGPYFQGFLKQGMPKLRGIAIEWGISKESVSLLLQLKNPLSSLRIECYPQSDEEVRLFERLLSKHSTSLQTLVIRFGESAEIKFPPFPKLKRLAVTRQKTLGWKKWGNAW